MIGGKVYRPLQDEPQVFKARTEAMAILKWLRQHGERGRDWEFAGSGRSFNLWFNNDQLEVLYILRWE